MPNTNKYRHFQIFSHENARGIWRFICASSLVNPNLDVKVGGGLRAVCLPAIRLLCIAVVIGGVALPVSAQLQSPVGDLPPAALAERMKKLESELRCLVCQNQTLAESPAGLAGDLRREVRTLIDQGKTDDEIKSFLQARYGDFVLYRPPVDRKTYLLWFGPFVLLVGGGLLLWWMARRRRQVIRLPDTRDANAAARARNLLNDE